MVRRMRRPGDCRAAGRWRALADADMPCDYLSSHYWLAWIQWLRNHVSVAHTLPANATTAQRLGVGIFRVNSGDGYYLYDRRIGSICRDLPADFNPLKMRQCLV